MKKLAQYSVFILAILIPSISIADTTYTSSSAIEDIATSNGGEYTLELSGSPYIFPNGISVTKNVTINIDPGVEIILGSNRSIQFFNGILNAIGTTENPILIRPQSGFLNQVRFFSTTENTTEANLENVKISNAEYCSLIGKSIVNYKNVTVENCHTSPINIGGNGIDAIFDNIIYNKITNPINGAFMSISFNSLISTESPINILFTNSNINIDDGLFAKITDQSGGVLTPDGIDIRINSNTFSGQVSGANVFRIQDSNGVANLPFQIDATDNYWGTPEGPYYSGTLPATNGPQLPSNIDFIPFRTTPELEEPKAECCSSIIFIPGIQGSRLYKLRAGNTEDQLWEANWKSDLSEMYLDQAGDSIDSGIYTRDVIDKTKIGESIGLSSLDQNIYKNIIDNLNDIKNTDDINSYIYPYDWRLDVDTIINNGTKISNGSYIKLIDKLHELSEDSPTGKVTITAHSMGGLLTKRFIQTLSPEDQKLIDKVIFIAVPNLGTTEGLGSILGGISFEGIYGEFITRKYARALAENMVTAHSLVPSVNYFNSGNVPVFINPGAVDLVPELAVYNGQIDSFEKLESFITGVDGRADAEFGNVGYPNIAPASVFSKAKSLHANIDNYEIPEIIEVFNIIGTGRSTPKSIIYDKYNFQGIDFISYSIGKTNLGDGTVVQHSAESINASNTYYVDLYNYNKDNGSNNEHKTISGIEPVNALIRSIVTELPGSEISYINHIPNANNINTLAIGMHSPVDIHLYDSAGRHTGPVYIDVNGEIVRFIEENIPNSEYNEYGEAKYINAPDTDSYDLKLDGYNAGTFTLDIERFNGDESNSKELFANLPAGEDMVADINITPGNPVLNISLDADGDGDPDILAKNDGTIIELNKEKEECRDKKKDKKEKDKKCKAEKKDKKPKIDKGKKPINWHNKNKQDRDYKNNKNRR